MGLNNFSDPFEPRSCSAQMQVLPCFYLYFYKDKDQASTTPVSHYEAHVEIWVNRLNRGSFTQNNTPGLLVQTPGYGHKNAIAAIILHTSSFFHFSFSRKKLRVCGAEVEWTLQKGGGGFEFAIKIVAYHSLPPSFSPLKSIIFLV